MLFWVLMGFKKPKQVFAAIYRKVDIYKALVSYLGKRSMSPMETLRRWGGIEFLEGKELFSDSGWSMMNFSPLLLSCGGLTIQGLRKLIGLESVCIPFYLLSI